jgi:hypothetical protein
MTHPLAETSPSTRGRILAALCLLVIIGGITAQTFIADRLVVRDDAARTAAASAGDDPGHTLITQALMDHSFISPSMGPDDSPR